MGGNAGVREGELFRCARDITNSSIKREKNHRAKGYDAPLRGECLSAQYLINAYRGQLPGTHGLNHGGGSGDSVTAGPDCLMGCKSCLIHKNAALLIDRKPRCSVLDEGIGRGARDMITQSAGASSSLPGTTIGRRRPELSGSPSSIRIKVMEETSPCSSPWITVGAQRVRRRTPSSSACSTSSRRAGRSSMLRR